MLRLAVQPYTLHFRTPAATSRGALHERRIWLLRTWDSEQPELAGWGECGPMPGLSRDDRPDFGEVVAEVCGVINAGYLPGPGDLAHLPSFAFGLDTALRDLRGGGRRVLWQTPFARGERGLPTHGLIWMDTVEGLHRQIDAKLAAGFRVIKLKVGALPFDAELALLESVRSRYTPKQVELRLDANGAFAAGEALAKLNALAHLHIAFLEQPIAPGQWDALATICRHSPIPIVLDEELIRVTAPAERLALLDAVRPQGLVLKPALLGGFDVAEAWIAAAEARAMQWWINSALESNIGLNAICQWTSAVGGDRVHGLGTGGLFTNNMASPLRLRHNELWLDPSAEWALPGAAIR